MVKLYKLIPLILFFHSSIFAGFTPNEHAAILESKELINNNNIADNIPDNVVDNIPDNIEEIFQEEPEEDKKEIIEVKIEKDKEQKIEETTKENITEQTENLEPQQNLDNLDNLKNEQNEIIDLEEKEVTKKNKEYISENVKNDFTEVKESQEIKIESRFTSPFSSLAPIIKPLMKAVVDVYTIDNKNHNLFNINELDNFDYLKEFFSNFDSVLENEENKNIHSGTGFLIDENGYIVTNSHILEDEKAIFVKIDDLELPATLIGKDPLTDLALLKIDSEKKFSYVKFGDSDKAEVGDLVIILGNPFGFSNTATAGIISSKGRMFTGSNNNILGDLIQTDAALNPGNSGGPMFNLKGEVIGISSFIYSPSGKNIGLGFAIPSNTAKKITEKLKTSGKVKRGHLGIIIQEINSEIAESLDLSENKGVLIADVLKEGEQAGLKAGDIITHFNNKSISNIRKLKILLSETEIGDKIPLEIIRNRESKTIYVTVKESPTEYKNPIQAKNNDQLIKPDVTFSNITSKLKNELALNKEQKGIIVVAVEKNSKAFLHGLRVGDIILEANQKEINNVNDLEKIYQETKDFNKKNIVLLVQKKHNKIFIVISTEK